MRIISVIVLLFLFACNDPNPQKPLQEEDVEILTQVLIVEGVLQDFTGPERDSLAVKYYDQIYDRFGIDEAYLQNMRDRYSEDVTLWQRSADSVIARLEEGRKDVTKLIQID